MDTKGFIYAATMTNRLAEDISEEQWDSKLIAELGTLRKLFIHMVRIRDIYRDGLHTGIITFPGELISNESNLIAELKRSRDDLAYKFLHTEVEKIEMGSENLSIEELLNAAVHHEGIHQGQYFVALKQAGIQIPKQWEDDWNM
ncbi:DinB family protein [Virgibacillus necropolis]|uniref:DinB family protein n=1 Tax=Virgibacillus necropolis TaxID=163877 RepID=UPI00384CBDA1